MDETQPLLAAVRAADPVLRDGVARKDIVGFDANGDPANPIEWPRAYKWGVVSLLALMAFLVTFTCIAVVPIASRIVYDLDDGRVSKSSSVLLVTIWELGEATGPLLIAPLSEVFGRYPVINAANTLFVISTALAALSQSSTVFIIARAMTGLSVASNVLGPAIVGDMFLPEERGSAISLIALAPLLGGSVGPAIAGAIAETLGWRRVIWLSVFLSLTCAILSFTCFRETYKVVILQRRVERLRKETGNPMLRSVHDTDGQKLGLRKIWESILRPASVLIGSGVLQVLALEGAVMFSYYYIWSTTFPDVLQQSYNLSPAAAGLTFVSFSIGSLVCLIFMNTMLDKIYVNLRERNKGVGAPEFRLPISMIGAIIMPLSVVAYGWATQLHVPLPVLLTIAGFTGLGMILILLPLHAYVVDAFGLYAASGMTVIIVSRCLMSTFLPLAADPLIKKFDWGVGMSIMGGIGLLLAPIPVLVFRYGARWRQMSSYTKDE